MRALVNIVNETAGPIPALDWEGIIKQTARVLKKKKLAPVSFIFVDKKRSRDLNMTYRKKVGPANVLAFREEREVVLTLEIIKKEDLVHIIVHGLLHLEGFDHSSPGQVSQMEALEKNILKKLGINII